MAEGKLIIELSKVDIWQQDTLVLADVDLKIDKGEWIYLVGRVGSGKTSLIRTLNAELPLYKGYAKVSGFSLSALKKKELPLLRRKLGVVFQDFKLLMDRNVFSNLQFVLEATGWKQEKAIKDRIDEVLNQVGMTGAQERRPHQLSGGEQQRIAIARALLNNPEIILADEPTGNLDPETSEEIMQLFQQINKKGKTIIIATHDYLMLSKFPARTMVCEHFGVNTLNNSKIEIIDFESLLA